MKCPYCQKEMELDIDLVKKSREFGDKAIVVIGRTAGEDRDNSATEGSYLLSKGEEDMLITHAQLMRVMKIMEAAFRSDELGAPVEIEDAIC